MAARDLLDANLTCKHVYCTQAYGRRPKDPCAFPPPPVIDSPFAVAAVLHFLANTFGVCHSVSVEQPRSVNEQGRLL